MDKNHEDPAVKVSECLFFLKEKKNFSDTNEQEEF